MPPPLVEDRSSKAGKFPFRQGNELDKRPDQEEDDKDEDSSNDDGDVEEFIVEEILQHRYDHKRNQFTYKVKWLGYDNSNDLTWEPAENLETASDIVNEYHVSIGGPPQPPQKPSKKRELRPGGKKRLLEEDTHGSNHSNGSRRSRKKQNTTEDDSSENPVKDIPIRKAKYPPKNDNEWDKYIACVNTIEEIANKMGTKDRWGLVTWDNGELTRHRLGYLHSNAPQSMLKFYETNLVFRETNPLETDANGTVINSVEDDHIKGAMTTETTIREESVYEVVMETVEKEMED